MNGDKSFVHFVKAQFLVMLCYFCMSTELKISYFYLFANLVFELPCILTEIN